MDSPGIVQTIDLAASQVDADDEGLWAITPDQLVRINPSSGESEERVVLPDQPFDLAVAGDEVYVAVTDAGVMRLEGDSVTAVEGDFGGAPEFLTTSPEGLWISGADGTLTLIGCDGDVERQGAHEGGGPAASVGDQLWFVGRDATDVVDAQSLEVIDELPLRSFGLPTEGGSGVWMTGGPQASLTLVDPQTLDVVREGDLSSETRWVGSAVEIEDAVLATGDPGTVLFIDPDDLVVKSTISTGGSSRGLLPAFDRVWVATGEAVVGIGSQ